MNGTGIQQLLPFESLMPVRDGAPGLREFVRRHYSARHYRDGRNPKKIVGPGEYLILTTPNVDALIVFRKSNREIAGRKGVYLSFFRNESWRPSSHLIKQALWLAGKRWPGEKVFTLVNPRKVKTRIPGYCFRRAGFKHTGNTKKGLMIFERRLPNET